MIHKYSIIVGRILNISKTNIYIEEYFEVEIILLLLDMYWQQFGGKCICQLEDVWSICTYLSEWTFPNPKGALTHPIDTYIFPIVGRLFRISIFKFNWHIFPNCWQFICTAWCNVHCAVCTLTLTLSVVCSLHAKSKKSNNAASNCNSQKMSWYIKSACKI